MDSSSVQNAKSAPEKEDSEAFFGVRISRAAELVCLFFFWPMLLFSVSARLFAQPDIRAVANTLFIFAALTFFGVWWAANLKNKRFYLLWAGVLTVGCLAAGVVILADKLF